MSLIPLGYWIEYCLWTVQKRKKVLNAMRTEEIVDHIRTALLWYLRYAFNLSTVWFRKKPTFFIAGFSRCGTTYLSDLLRSLECIGGPTPLAGLSKETHKYSSRHPIYSLMPIQGFFPLIRASYPDQRFDASVEYAHEKQTLLRIKHDIPKAKIVLLVRDQVSRFESHFNYFKISMENIPPEEIQYLQDPELFRSIQSKQLLDIISHMRKTKCSRLEAVNHCLPVGTSEIIRDLYVFLIGGFYHYWVGLALEIFGVSNVLVLDFKELTQNPKQSVGDVLRFLQLPENLANTISPSTPARKAASSKFFKLNPKAAAALAELFEDLEG